MKAKAYMSILMVVLLAFTSFFGVVDAQEEDGWNVVVDEGTTDRFGGGQYRYFKFTNDAGTDAMFGVIWGDEDNSNAITMVSTQARYLAKVRVTAQASDSGTKERFVKINSMLGTSIGRIYEYNDSNDNGAVNLLVDDEGGVTSEMEEVYKYVDLRDADWTSSELINGTEGDNQTWEFTLTAEDLPYEPLAGETLSLAMEQEVLEYVNFTFHLTAGTKEVEGVEMPSFDVQVRQGIGNRVKLQEIKKNGTDEVSGVVGSYDMKWDHEIQGWDYETDNANPRLVMGFRNVYGNQMPTLRNRWKWMFMHQAQNKEGVHFKDQQGEHVTNFSQPEQMRERKLRQNRINYGGEWSRTGRFRWESNVTVDGEPDKMTAQIIHGAPMIRVGPMTRNFVGFQVFGGLNYPGGEDIYHDPGQSGSSFLEVSETEEQDGRSPFIPAIGKVLIVLVAAVAIVAALMYKKNERQPRDQYDRQEPRDEEGWSDYYDRNR